MSSLIQPAPIGTVRRQFLKSQSTFDSHAAVFEAVSARLLQRLELLAIQPQRVLDLGCRSGYQLATLGQRYPDATIVGADPAPGPLKRLPGSWPRWLQRTRAPADCQIACDPHQLPFANGSFDLVISNLLLPWCEAPHRVFEEAARVLAPGGAFMFTSAGPDTLMEYRRAWASIDSYLHSFGLLDMHDLGDSMMASGFAAPVLDRDNLTIDYPDVHALETELRNLGAVNIAGGRRRGLLSPAAQTMLNSSFVAGERLAVTLELVQGHGWKGELVSAVNSSGDITVSVDTLKGSWRQKAGR